MGRLVQPYSREEWEKLPWYQKTIWLPIGGLLVVAVVIGVIFYIQNH